MTSPFNETPDPNASPEGPQQPVDNSGDIPNVNLGTPDGTTVVGPGMPDEPQEEPIDANSPDFYDRMSGIVSIEYTGDESLTLGTVRFSKGDVFETSNENALGLLSGENGSSFKRV